MPIIFLSILAFIVVCVFVFIKVNNSDLTPKIIDNVIKDTSSDLINDRDKINNKIKHHIDHKINKIEIELDEINKLENKG